MSSLDCISTVYAYEYEPPEAVILGQSFPHFSVSGANNEISFNSTTEDEFSLQTYVDNVGGAPFYFAVVGIAAVVIFQILIIARHECCSIHVSLKCGPENIASGHRDGWQLRIIKQRDIVYALYNTFLVLLFCANHLVFLSYNDLASGADKVKGGVGDLVELGSDLLSISYVMTNELSQVDANINATSSCASSTTKDLLFDIGLSIGNFDSTMNQATGGLTGLLEYLDPRSDIPWIGTSNVHNTVEASVFGFYLVILILITVLAIIPCCQQVTPLRILNVIMQFIIVVLTLICALELVSVIIMSDFCMEPSDNLIAAVQHLNDFANSSNVTAVSATGASTSSSDIPGLVRYYSECTDISPFHDTLSEVYTQVNTLKTHLSSRYDNSTDTCYQEAHLSLSIVLLDSILSKTNYLSCSLSCAVVGSMWSSTLHSGFCTHYLPGFITFWAQKLFVSVFLYAFICACSITYQYFGDWWYMKSYSVFPEEYYSGSEPETPSSSPVPRKRRRSRVDVDDPVEEEHPDVVSPFNPNDVGGGDREWSAERRGGPEMNPQVNLFESTAAENGTKQDVPNGEEILTPSKLEIAHTQVRRVESKTENGSVRMGSDNSNNDPTNEKEQYDNQQQLQYQGNVQTQATFHPGPPGGYHPPPPGGFRPGPPGGFRPGPPGGFRPAPPGGFRPNGVAHHYHHANVVENDLEAEDIV